MAAIGDVTREKIKGFLEAFIEGLVSGHRKRPADDVGHEVLAPGPQTSSKGNLKPFHAAIVPSELMRINAFERSFSTRLGTTFEECARLIALDYHKWAARGHKVTANVSDAAYDEIGRQRELYEHAPENKGHKPSLDQMAAAVLDARRDDDLTKRTVTADLYVLSRDNMEYFFEIKSPKPNKGQCLEIAERLLRFHLIAGKPRPMVSAYFAMAYNPYGPTRADYKHNYALTYMPFDQAVVIGNEFWEIIGGAAAYAELLEIYEEVGREKTKYMIDALAFGL